ncbi:DUF2147 domain-containing protein [Acidocella sp.]|uniref:DUF2147 domain-containing protein n=1 Tax=Acidocella sp. TaxID=50710 RepID=UPI002632334B|nr:DUF2147 domain-containing protein [Acidocella sp.]
MFRRVLAAALLGGGILVGAAAGAASAPQPVSGQWLTADHQAVIALAPCGAAECGRIVGMVFDHPNDPEPLDWRGRAQCGETIITVTPTSDGSWQGEVLDPRTGTRYRAKLWRDAGRLALRGYVLTPLLGETQNWRAFAGQILPGCHLPG